MNNQNSRQVTISYCEEVEYIEQNSELVSICSKIIYDTSCGRGSFITRFKRAIQLANISEEKVCHLDHNADYLVRYLKGFALGADITNDKAKDLFYELTLMHKNAIKDYELGIYIYCKLFGKHPFQPKE